MVTRDVVHMSRILLLCLPSSDLFTHVSKTSVPSLTDTSFSVPMSEMERTSFHLCLYISPKIDGLCSLD